MEDLFKLRFGAQPMVQHIQSVGEEEPLHQISHYMHCLVAKKTVFYGDIIAYANGSLLFTRMPSIEHYSISWDPRRELGLTGSNAAVAIAAAGVCGCGWLRFLAVLRDLYDWFCG
ncbi:hypothetical protein YC2023_025064 [Brassica napus]